MKKTLLISLLLVSLSSFSQDCNCESNLNWVKKIFERNDAGFSYSLNNKGEELYKKHNKIFIQRAKKVNELMKCREIISEWLNFFRSAHVSIRALDKKARKNISEELSNEEIKELYKDWYSVDINVKEFTKYLESKKEIDYEGIWSFEIYKIGVKKIKNEYLGFIIEADGVYWTKGQVKFKINPDNSMIYYTKDHSKRTFASLELLGFNYLKTGNIILKRIAPKYIKDPKIEKYFKLISSNKPYFEVINDKTNYLRIPTFEGSKKVDIDSVIRVNKELIVKTPNLIIDIRNNGGGSDRSYKELLPILYTNPIRTIGVELLSTPLNNQRMLDFINDPKYGFDKEGKKWAKNAYDKLSKQIGNYVNLDSTDVDIVAYDTIYSFPTNVGIIINENNGSTAEQFLLAAKQSKKVKLFGTTTFGVLDISNMYFVKSPCEEFELGYSLSRSLRIPEMTIDDKGIQPDYYIDKNIPKYEWIQFVINTLN